MIDPAIEKFFEERKEGWLKKKTSSLTEDQMSEKIRECEEIFLLENWLPNAAKRAGQMSIVTHHGKFSHPSSKITPIISNAKERLDGYLRSGNVHTERDALGNAAAMDVYKFLTLTMQDSRTLIDHILEDSPLAISLLTINSMDYQTLKRYFLEMISPQIKEVTTDSRVKQVYFPVRDGYHQLSILSNAGLISVLKERIKHLLYSDEIKELREKKRKKEYSDQEYLEIYDLTVIGYGGTKPQNISVLNNSNSGKFYLLPSWPPILKKRDIHFPKYDFFKESLKWRDYNHILHALGKIFKTNYNNLNIREGRDYYIHDLMDLIIDRMNFVRSISTESYRLDLCHLKHFQRIWLCPDEYQRRQDESLWLDELCRYITRWIILRYEKLNESMKLGEAERSHIEGIVNQYREDLR